MNFALHGAISVILMSRRSGAPYADRIEDAGKTLIYEGHDEPRTAECPEPKRVDQPRYSKKGSLTQNGLFWDSVLSYKEGRSLPARVRVYEKIKTGIWTFAGVFALVDAWVEENERKTFRFKLQIIDAESEAKPTRQSRDVIHNRLIPSLVKIQVWKRDKGKCVLCGSQKNLHFDHDLPFSKGGTSLLAENIRLLCAAHNLRKRDKIE